MNIQKMHRLITSLCFLVLAVGIRANEIGDEKAIERGDAYIDKLLEDMFENRVEEYDPYRIEDSVVGFNRKVLFVNVSGEAKLYDGYIKGLSTLHRTEHCSLYDKGDRMRVKADLGAGQLDFHYSGSVKFMNVGPTITVQGILAYIEVHTEFTVDSKTGTDGKLEEFIIDDTRGMKVWVTGLGPLNWAVNPIITGVTKVFKRFVRNFLENKVEKHIAARISDFQFPVEDTSLETTVSTSSEPSTSEKPEVTETKETVPPETTPPEVTEIKETIPPETPEVTETETVPPETTPPEVVETEETVPPEPVTQEDRELIDTENTNPPEPDLNLEESSSNDLEDTSSDELPLPVEDKA